MNLSQRKWNPEEKGMLAVTGSPEVLHIHVPPLPRAGDCLAAITSLLRLQEEGSPTASWVVDLSELCSPPLSLVGVLVGLRTRFRERGRELTIMGVKPTLAASGRSIDDDMSDQRRSPMLTSALAMN